MIIKRGSEEKENRLLGVHFILFLFFVAATKTRVFLWETSF